MRCTMGAIHDVIVDLRRGSPTYLQAYGVELSAANRTALYIRRGSRMVFRHCATIRKYSI